MTTSNSTSVNPWFPRQIRRFTQGTGSAWAEATFQSEDNDEVWPWNRQPHFNLETEDIDPADSIALLIGIELTFP